MKKEDPPTRFESFSHLSLDERRLLLLTGATVAEVYGTGLAFDWYSLPRPVRLLQFVRPDGIVCAKEVLEAGKLVFKSVSNRSDVPKIRSAIWCAEERASASAP